MAVATPVSCSACPASRRRAAPRGRRSGRYGARRCLSARRAGRPRSPPAGSRGAAWPAGAQVPQPDPAARRAGGDDSRVGREGEGVGSVGSGDPQPLLARAGVPGDDGREHDEATRTRPSRVNARSPGPPGDRLDVHACVRAQRADLDRRLGRSHTLVLHREQPAVGRERHRVTTGAGKRSRRTTARERTSRIVTVPALPPVASRRPSGVKAIASAGVPSRAGRSAMRRLARRSTSVTVPSPRLDAITSPRGATTKQGLAKHVPYCGRKGEPAPDPPRPLRVPDGHGAVEPAVQREPAVVQHDAAPPPGRSIVPYVSTMSPEATSHTWSCRRLHDDPLPVARVGQAADPARR